MTAPTPEEVREVCSRQAAVGMRFALAAARIGETNGYRMARETPEELPFKVLRIGSRYKVPTASLLAGLGLSPLKESDQQLTAC
ncbi:hypothetical protein WDY80_05130 [Gordonia hongkongensis]|uniref:hypothetical protein n=1 Tax=Gordonia hongkongensis TaxID=1701090 RepID=UPI0030CCE216